MALLTSLFANKNNTPLQMKEKVEEQVEEKVEEQEISWEQFDLWCASKLGVQDRPDRKRLDSFFRGKFPIYSTPKNKEHTKNKLQTNFEFQVMVNAKKDKFDRHLEDGEWITAYTALYSDIDKVPARYRPRGGGGGWFEVAPRVVAKKNRVVLNVKITINIEYY